MWTEVEIASDLECQRTYNSNGEVICGRVNPGSSICRGDSGGPLVHLEKRTLIGVSSFVFEGPCDKGQLVGFVNVVNYLPWIYEVSGVKPIN
ncbi:serine proteases 1/2-like [Drosophila serrata]|uniref:serine proteases 1/2-like n=1 Tax=Drosophila serrata TaxID=7274 RepID=UPI000A1D2B7E|nr:serine proteases 1/2-like [Drosophila serrata]